MMVKRFEAVRSASLKPERTGAALTSLVILTQRIALPWGEGGLPVTPVLVLIVLFAASHQLGAQIRPYAAVAFCAYLAYSVALCVGTEGSWTSALLVALIWLPFVFSFSATSIRGFLRGITITTAIAAGLGAIQSFTSAVTNWYPDPLQFVPIEFTVQGFNSSYPVVYGTHWMKANGFFFLEPALLSLFSVIALVLVVSGAVTFKKNGPLVAITLIVGLLSSVAVSGFVIAPALFIAILASKRRWLIICGTVVALPVLAMLPQASAFLARAFAGDGGTSNDARLLRPYVELVPRVLTESPIFGFGPGSSRRYVQSHFYGWENEVTTPTLVKVLFEYGLLGAVILFVVLIALITRSRVPISVRLAFILALTVPTDALSNAVIAQTAILALAAATSVSTIRASRQPLAADRPVAIGNAEPPVVPTTLKSMRLGH